jgi:hypothetical protein
MNITLMIFLGLWFSVSLLAVVALAAASKRRVRKSPVVLVNIPDSEKLFAESRQ